MEIGLDLQHEQRRKRIAFKFPSTGNKSSLKGQIEFPQKFENWRKIQRAQKFDNQPTTQKNNQNMVTDPVTLQHQVQASIQQSGSSFAYSPAEMLIEPIRS